MARVVLMCLAVAMVAGSAVAETGRITSRDAFVQIVKDRALTTTGIRLNVSPDGRLEGRAFGFAVTGSWSWQGGYFCREMKAGPREIPLDCQLVERLDNTLRFTAQKGKGDTADLRLR